MCDDITCRGNKQCGIVAPIASIDTTSCSLSNARTPSTRIVLSSRGHSSVRQKLHVKKGRRPAYLLAETRETSCGRSGRKLWLLAVTGGFSANSRYSIDAKSCAQWPAL